MKVDAVCCGCGRTSVATVTAGDLTGFEAGDDLRAVSRETVEGRMFFDDCKGCRREQPHNVVARLDGLMREGSP